MATVTLKGNPFQTVGNLPAIGAKAPEFTLTGAGLADVKLSDFAGKRVVLNIFPSVDTPTCATSVRTFNKALSSLQNTVVLNVSADLPFAQARFCGAEGLENVLNGSSFRSSFGQDYGVTFANGPLAGLLSRAVVVINEQGTVVHTEQVAETADEPGYEAALKVLN
ncbi:MAG TPA: thiol peroxidase [Rheinheimera sp.]|uniref:thiol peroxidase n=1 Tax=unclassified Rheinheimera TaxID=115860 RepID=UPI000EC8AED1|nr:MULTISPECIES: thiol peroxidase [unclassified Rheinheimera]MCT6699205.1 thiol peroxidase [Rheinheimera sp. 4Y26]HCU67024.1 thiol peroxidase [Rheinheimera sp.]